MIICTHYDLIYSPPMDVNSKPCTEFALQTTESWLWYEPIVRVASQLSVGFLFKKDTIQIESGKQIWFILSPKPSTSWSDH